MLPNGVMNAEDVARYLHLGKNTVYQLAKSGQIASYHVGRKLRFSIDDVEAYVAATRQAPTAAPFAGAGGKGQEAAAPAKPVLAQQATVSAAGDSEGIAAAAWFGRMPGNSLILAGGDIAADILASSLNAAGQPTDRLVRGSYTSLVNLYAGDADAALVHLYDQRSNSYNIPYVLGLAPGASVVVYRLFARKQGLIVLRGNPKGLTTWGSLLHEGVRLSNRAKGSGARVLLDEKLRAMEARSELIEGYSSHAAVASAAISRVAAGISDVAIGTAREAARERGVDFVPLQTEWVDLVVAKTPQMRPVIRNLEKVLTSRQFAAELEALQPIDTAKLGSVVYES